MAAAPRTTRPGSPAGSPSTSPPVSEELHAPVAPGIELCYQTFGDPGDEPLLLVMGLGGPMTWWDPELCTQLAERGFFVVRYDNRDTGRSSRVRQRVPRTAVVRAFLGQRVRTPYTMSDLASDAAGLLDHLGIDAAHVAGVSMGGMIGQTLAIEHPDRVLSLTSIMSSTGRRTAGWQHPRLFPGLLAARGAGREAYVAGSVAFWELIGSPAYRNDPETVRRRAEETFDRGYSASGVLRQMLAVLTQPNRERALRDVRVPVCVMHGLADPMVHVSGGRATARAVPGAELVLVDGMAHDVPTALHRTIVDAVRRTADRAAAQAGDRAPVSR
ncbi:alpha/beta fold hydrolase [Nocardioides perillae]|uniref:Pimeloyl-ACP methyl ester carboxylesterase n=1 Tax=Nocardioides perillae TaxID=1119534 RepID=A0A7Y9RZC3_9ACTN|nr:alpha/beta hydrolase [Nocardioides perillae]NYG56735.1 pimeloyl-ACP methyl ester carboxylesterase [Nocardioides perillae]